MRWLSANFALCAGLICCSAFGADNATCPPLQGVVLHLKPSEHGYLLPVVVAGTPRMFLLDLGAAYSKLDEAVAKDLKLPLAKAPFSLNVGQTPFAQIATVPSLSIGAVRRGESQVFVGALRDDWGGADGIAGMNMFSGFDVELDLAHNRLGLYLPRDCAFQPFWPTDVFGEAPIKLEKTGGMLLPMTLDGQEIEANLETLVQQSTMRLAALQILFNIDSDDPRLTPVPSISVGKDVFRSPFEFPFKTLTGGQKVTINNPSILVVREQGMLCSGVAGRLQYKERMMSIGRWAEMCFGGGDVSLGTNLLLKLHLYFAFKDEKVYFTPAEPVVGPRSNEMAPQRATGAN